MKFSILDEKNEILQVNQLFSYSIEIMKFTGEQIILFNIDKLIYKFRPSLAQIKQAQNIWARNFLGGLSLLRKPGPSSVIRYTKSNFVSLN